MKEITCCDIATGKYFIDEDGNIYSMYKKGYINGHPDRDGYISVLLKTNQGQQKRFNIHKLVMLTFGEYPPSDMKSPTIDHIDGNNQNNKFENLRWLERKMNSSLKHIPNDGERNGRHKLTEKDVLVIIDRLLLGETFIDISKDYNVTPSTICDIKNKIHWKYLTKDIVFN